MKKWDTSNYKIFCTAKEAFKELGRQPIEWKKTLANDMFNNRLILKIYKYRDLTITREYRKLILDFAYFIVLSLQIVSFYYLRW